jgi:predicted nucleic acid-binding protein
LAALILVDSNILIDIFVRDPIWAAPSAHSLTDAAGESRVCVNQIIVSEVAPRFDTLDEFIGRVVTFGIEIELLDNEASYCAGLAFNEYRRRRRSVSEVPKSVLPDFFIGGHAQILGASILTRDPRFYRTYFPSVPLITPSKDEQ